MFFRYDGSGGPNIEVEQCLPGVILANKEKYIEFLLQLADLGTSIKHLPLQEASRALLRIIPADKKTVERLRSICRENLDGKRAPQQIWESVFFSSSPSATLYNLQICNCLLMPSSTAAMDKTFEFQINFVRARGVPAVNGMLTKNNFLAAADLATKRAAHLIVLKMSKFLFSVAGYSLVHMVADACQPDSSTSVTPATHNQAVVLQQAMHHVPNPSTEMMVRNFAQRVAPSLLGVGSAHMPDHATVSAIIRLAWASASGNPALAAASTDELDSRLKGDHPPPDEEDVAVCREALEVLTLAVALRPTSLDALTKDKSWQSFVIGLVLYSRVKVIRCTAADQFLLMATRCHAEQTPLR